MASFSGAVLLVTQLLLFSVDFANAKALSLSEKRSPTNLAFPNAPASNIQVIDGTFQSFSIEYAYMGDYAGNQTSPNLLSKQLLQNLADRSGVASHVRVGGSTSNLFVYDASQTQGIVLGFRGGSPDQPNKVTIGPKFYESFHTFPTGTQYIYDLNYTSNTTGGLDETAAEADRVYSSLGDKLYAFEMGNEMQGWGGKYRANPWNRTSYTIDFLKYAAKIANVLGSGAPKSLFQAGTFTGLGGLTFTPARDPWNAQNILTQGIAKTGQVKSISIHDYMGSNCGTKPFGPARLSYTLMNHTNVAWLISPHASQSNIAAAAGVKYVLGETNSISCQGQDMISNVFGAALWGIDYQLYAAAISNISGIYFHQGTPYRYSSWQPIDFRGVAKNIRPAYYGNLFVATLLSGGNKQIQLIKNDTHMTGYGVYTAGKLTHAVLINLQEYNATAQGTPSTVSRGWQTFTLPSPFTQAKSKVYRLTAPGANWKTNTTFAGVTVDLQGKLSNTETTEALRSGNQVIVADSEAVLVAV